MSTVIKNTAISDGRKFTDFDLLYDIQLEEYNGTKKLDTLMLH
jgi:hypothetical protein